MRFGILSSPVYGTSGIHHIGKYAAWTQENIVVAGYSRIYRNVILNLDIIAQHHFGEDHAVLSDTAVFTNFTTGKYMRKMPDFCPFPYFTIPVNNGSFMNKIIHIVIFCW